MSRVGKCSSSSEKLMPIPGFYKSNPLMYRDDRRKEREAGGRWQKRLELLVSSEISQRLSSLTQTHPLSSSVSSQLTYWTNGPLYRSNNTLTTLAQNYCRFYPEGLCAVFHIANTTRSDRHICTCPSHKAKLLVNYTNTDVTFQRCLHLPRHFAKSLQSRML